MNETVCFVSKRDGELRIAFEEHVIMIYEGDVETVEYVHLAPPFNTYEGYVDFMRERAPWIEIKVPFASDP